MSNFIIKTRRNGEYQFNLKSANGEIILTSEGYTTKNNCRKGIASVRLNAGINSRFVRKISRYGKHYFNLKAGNGRIIGTSEMYNSRAGMEKGVRAVRGRVGSLK